MSTIADPSPSSERIPASRQRYNPLVLPANMGEEDLARDWTLSEVDNAQVSQCRGDENRRRFAVQLCVLRKYGRFLDQYERTPVRIINHLSKQLGLQPVLLLHSPGRSATETGHEQRIREYLGWQSFDGVAQERLEGLLFVQAMEGFVPGELFEGAQNALRSWKVVLPAPSTLERIVTAVCVRAQEEIFNQTAAQIPSHICAAIDKLLTVVKGDRRSGLFRLKMYPPEASTETITDYIERFHELRSMGVREVTLKGLKPNLVRYLADLAQHYDAQSLKRFALPKRYTMVACFLTEAYKTILDHLVDMNDQFLVGMCRRSRHAFEKRHREFRRRSREGLATLLEAMELLLDTERPRETTLAELYQEIDEQALREARDTCHEYKRLEERGYFDRLLTRYGVLRRYWPAFLDLPFEAHPGSESILDGIVLARRLNAGNLRELPEGAPTEFVPTAWRSALKQRDGIIDRRLWEIALALAARDALRSGDLYLPESRHHTSFWNLVYDEARWEKECEQCYLQLNLPSQAERMLLRLREEFESAACAAEHNIKENSFATISENKLQLKRQDALEVPERVREIQQAIEAHLPRVRIEDLLASVNSWSNFTKEFQPLGGYQPRSENLPITLLAALVAHGTNLGISAMGHSAEGITVEMLQHVTQWFLREETLRAANAALVNHHNRLNLSRVWGEGTRSSSDGQRFGIQGQSLLASFYPRYFGYYDRAVTVYTHVSDQYSAFGTRVISCMPREALYVLDGLLENDTVLRPSEHSTDTHGYTEHIFGLCYLLGFSFMPRIRDLTDQQLYKTDREKKYQQLEPLFRGAVDTGIIQEQYDALVRVAASLKNRTAPAHVVVQRLVSSSPSDRLAKALTQLGRVVKTIYILRYINDENLRRRVQLQLNRGEHRHKLAKWLFFANQGEFRRGDYEGIMNKASCLSLLSNATLVWNTVEISNIVERLRARGEPILNEDMARVSPLLYAHIIPNGTYHFDRAIQGVNIAHNALE